MEFTEVVLKRRMVRHFSDEPVSPEAIDRILDLARHAPSAGFTQGQSFVVVTRPDLKKAIAKVCGEEYYVERFGHPWISEAPVLVVACTSEDAYHRRYREPDKIQDDGNEIEWPVPYRSMDSGASIMVLIRAVVNEGLSAGFVGTNDLKGLRPLLDTPAEVTPVGVIPIGHRAPDVPSPSLKRGRKPEADFIHHERW